MINLDSKVPEGKLSEKWTNQKFNMKLVNPANKRKFDVIVVGTGLAGAGAAATLGERRIPAAWGESRSYCERQDNFRDQPQLAQTSGPRGVPQRPVLPAGCG